MIFFYLTIFNIIYVRYSSYDGYKETGITESHKVGLKVVVVDVKKLIYRKKLSVSGGHDLFIIETVLLS